MRTDSLSRRLAALAAKPAPKISPHDLRLLQSKGFIGRAIALKCHLFSLDPSLAKADMPLKFTTREYRLLSVTYASIL